MPTKNISSSKSMSTSGDDSSNQTTSMKEVGSRRVPRQARAVQKVEQILQAAADEVREGGLDRLNTNRIAEKAGLSIGTVYGYFPNKQSIIVALHTRWLETIVKLIGALHPSKGGPGDLFSYMRALTGEVDRLYGEGHWAGAFMAVAPGIPELKEVTTQHDAEVLQSIWSAVRHYAPQAPDEDINVFAAQLMTISDAVLSGLIGKDGAGKALTLSYLDTALVAMAVRVMSAGATRYS